MKRLFRKVSAIGKASRPATERPKSQQGSDPWPQHDRWWNGSERTLTAPGPVIPKEVETQIGKVGPVTPRPNQGAAPCQSWTGEDGLGSTAELGARGKVDGGELNQGMKAAFLLGMICAGSESPLVVGRGKEPDIQQELKETIACLKEKLEKLQQAQYQQAQYQQAQYQQAQYQQLTLIIYLYLSLQQTLQNQHINSTMSTSSKSTSSAAGKSPSLTPTVTLAVTLVISALSPTGV